MWVHVNDQNWVFCCSTLNSLIYVAISAPQPHCPKTTCSYWKIWETISTLHISWCNRPKSVLIWEGVNLELRLDYKRLGKWNHEIRLGLFILKCANVFELNSVCGKLVWFQVDRMGLELGTKAWSLGPIFTNKKHPWFHLLQRQWSQQIGKTGRWRSVMEGSGLWMLCILWIYNLQLRKWKKRIYDFNHCKRIVESEVVIFLTYFGTVVSVSHEISANSMKIPP